MPMTEGLAWFAKIGAGILHKAGPLTAGVALVLLALPLWAQGQGSRTEAARHTQAAKPILLAETDQQRQLLEQKLKLLETYVASKAARRIVDSGNTESKMLLGDARAHLEQARGALGNAALEDARQAIDDGLRKISQAMALLGKASDSRGDADERARYDALRRQVQAYREVIANARQGREPEAQETRAVDAIDRLFTDGEEHARSGRYRDANKALEQAYKAAVRIVAELYRGRTVVASLNFETPADEFDYERKRNGSYEILVALMLSQEETPQGLQKLAEQSIEDSRGLRNTAELQAKAGDYAAAISTLERATRRLVQVLRASGLSIPE